MVLSRDSVDYGKVVWMPKPFMKSDAVEYVARKK